MGYTEKEKSQASDSFKRACFNIGIGRELYTAPDFIWVTADKVKIQKKGENKFVTYDRFHVQSIEYNDQREISALVIANSWNKVVYSWIAPRAAAQKQGENSLSQSQMSNLQKELARTGVALEAVLERYHLNRPEDMDPDTYKQAMSSLKKTQARNNSAA